jgi:poly[(R)-3-hydroxyalkanoate] polymerase subunit PhaE
VTNPFDWTGEGSDQAKAMGEMWRSWVALSGASVPQTFTPPVTGNDGFADFLNPMNLALFGGAQVGDALKKMTEGPQLADAGTAEHRMARLMERWIEVQTASRAYEGVVAAAWVTANQSFAGKLQERFNAGEAMQPADALKLWLETANTALLETQRSPSFLEAQRRLLRCGMEFLLTQREVVESAVEPAGLPTRTEIDEVHRAIHDLKRRLRTLEREGGR